MIPDAKTPLKVHNTAIRTIVFDMDETLIHCHE